MPDPEVPPMLDAVERAAQSAAFSRSRRHADLLRFLAAHSTSADSLGDLKETVIGHRFFERPADYDPKLDPVVRVEVRRLRDRLQQYYEADGAADTWRIEIPRGAYALFVKPMVPATPEPIATLPPPAARPVAPWLIVAGLVVVLILGAVVGLRFWKSRRIDSIAVLPAVASVTGEREEAAVAGLSREIAGELSRISGLRVVGPEAALRAQASERDLPAIARRLEVDAILSSVVHADNGRLQLQAQLSRGADQSVIWSRTLERDLVDPFTLENELASSVASIIHSDLLRRPANTRPVAAEALADYQVGGLLLDRRSEVAIREAIGKFRSATAIDAGYANAWAALADALAIFPDYGLPEEGWAEEARAAAHKALELDPDNANAYAALGWIEFTCDLRAAAAVRLLTKAAELNPNHVTAQQRLAMVLLTQRRFREAEQRLRTALRLDALSPMVRVNLAELYYYQNDFAREEPELRAVLEMHPDLAVARVMMANMLSRVKRCSEAMPMARRVIEDVDGAAWQPSMAGVLARCGDLSLARELYRPQAALYSRQQVAEFFSDWPLALQFVEHMEHAQPGFLAEFAIGPDGRVFGQYPPIRSIFERVDRRVHQPE